MVCLEFNNAWIREKKLMMLFDIIIDLSSYDRKKFNWEGGLYKF